ncbi:MAG: DUF2249 domain-containing protein [Pyrinomonadaceae bacterium]
MRITGDTKVKDVLAIDERKMIDTLMWLAPAFERLRYPRLRRVMAGRVSVSQAARIARIPLTEMLYVLNLAIGADEAALSAELRRCERDDFYWADENAPNKPEVIAGVEDTDENVVLLDLMKLADERLDPMPSIAKGLAELKDPSDVLLIQHPFDPIPLRDMLARRGFSSWAEERKPGHWFIYFYRTATRANTSAHPQVGNEIYLRAFHTTA